MFPTLSTSTEDAAAAVPLAPRLVMVVDDDRVWAEQCCLALRSLGYDALIAQAPDEALALLVARPVDFAILDYDLAGHDGIALGHELTHAAAAQSRKFRFLVVTGQDARNVAIDALRASAADVLEKPVGLGDLRLALQRMEGLDMGSTTQADLLTALADLSGQMQRIAHLIEPTGPRPAPPTPPFQTSDSPNGAEPPHPTVLINHIRGLLKKESRRRCIGGGHVFGDPAWEMLLDLMLAKIEGRRVSVSSACIASGAPMSTALRLVGRLVEEDVLRKLPDPTDRRRHFLVINAQFEQPLLEYLTEQARKTPGD